MSNDSRMHGDAGAMLFLHALTGVHAGTGTALGVVDLPVQRERHTGWPNIPASSIKGVARDAARLADDAKQVTFGPPTDEADKHAGAVAFTDAHLLAFPVRSARGTFAWTTCRPALERFARDAALAGVAFDAALMEKLPAVEREKILVSSNSPLLIGAGEVVLEEFSFTSIGPMGDPRVEALGKALAALAVADGATAARFATNLAVLHEDDFGHFVLHATEVVARIGLDHDTKTVKGGALFYEEFVPAEAVFFGAIFARPSRRKGTEAGAADLLQALQGALPPTLQIGADETIGRGICQARVVLGGGK